MSKTRRWSLAQKEDSNSRPKPGLREDSVQLDKCRKRVHHMKLKRVILLTGQRCDNDCNDTAADSWYDPSASKFVKILSRSASSGVYRIICSYSASVTIQPLSQYHQHCTPEMEFALLLIINRRTVNEQQNKIH